MAKERVERDEEDLVRLYLTDIGQYPLLTKDDEVRLAQQIEAGNAARTELLTGGKRLTPAKKRELRKIGREGDNAQRTFVQSNLRLVVSIAKKYQASGLPLLDLIQEGNLGLMHAVEKFDWRKGFKFSTYATWWIRQAITRGIANTGRTIRLPGPRRRHPRPAPEGSVAPGAQARPPGHALGARGRGRDARGQGHRGPPLRGRAPLALRAARARTATPSSATSSRTAPPSRRSRSRPPRCCPTRSRSCSPRSTSASGRSSRCGSVSTAASPAPSKRSASSSTSPVSASARSRRARCRSCATRRPTPARATSSRSDPAGGTAVVQGTSAVG